MYSWIIAHNVILGFVTDIISLFISAALTVAIFYIEWRHTKERERREDEHLRECEELEKKAKRQAIEEGARVFIIDNDDEIDFLPLCQVASQLNIKKSHHRKIITRYLRCNSQLQKEILKQSNIPEIPVSMDHINHVIRQIDDIFKKNGFGRALLYDGAKYYHKAILNHSEEKVESINPYIFQSKLSAHGSADIFRKNIRVTFGQYMMDYLNNGKLNQSLGMDPPNSMLYEKCQLGNGEEYIVTFWIMRTLIDSCGVFFSVYGPHYFDENIIETQEEMYYYTALILTETYCKLETGEFDDKT